MGRNNFVKFVGLGHMSKLLMVSAAGLLLLAAVIFNVAKLSGTAAASTLNYCTTTGGYCITSPTGAEDDIFGENGGGTGKADQVLDSQATTACDNSGSVQGDCPFTTSQDEHLDSTYDGSPIQRYYFPYTKECVDAEGDTGFLWTADCNANAAEMVINFPFTNDHSDFQMINVYDTNNGNSSGDPAYVCAREANDEDLIVTTSTSGYRCMWHSITST